jgi:hypothetical protein
MAISVFPAPVTSSINASSITAASANTLYQGTVSLEPAIYQITCASSTIARVEFYSDNVTLITSAVTASGTVTINLGTAATRFRVWTDTGSNIVVTITKTAAALTDSAPSGTLDTVTTVGTSTYTGTSTSGYGYAVLVGGGGGGGGSNGGSSSAGGGGGGGVAEKLVQLTGSMSVTIGAGGTAGFGSGSVGSGQNGGAGGNSTFAGMTANGGGGGGTNSGGGGAGGSASGGTWNTTGTDGSANSGGGGSPGSGGSPQTIYKFVVATPGTGRTGNGFNTGGFSGTGYGAGASGSSHSNGPGGAGTAGVLYVLRY